MAKRIYLDEGQSSSFKYSTFKSLLIGDVGHAKSFQSQNNGLRDPLFSLTVIAYRINNTRY